MYGNISFNMAESYYAKILWKIMRNMLASDRRLSGRSDNECADIIEENMKQLPPGFLIDCVSVCRFIIWNQHSELEMAILQLYNFMLVSAPHVSDASLGEKRLSEADPNIPRIDRLVWGICDLIHEKKDTLTYFDKKCNLLEIKPKIKGAKHDYE